jgi:hypothetical protein
MLISNAGDSPTYGVYVYSVWGDCYCPGTIDDCGVCDSNDSNNNTPLTGTCDCNSTPNGTAYTDDCNTCVGGATNVIACAPDCTGAYGGADGVANSGDEKSNDLCNVCGGTCNTTCDPCNVCNGTGVAGACDCVDTSGLNSVGCCDAIVKDCAGTCGGEVVLDACGECDGNNPTECLDTDSSCTTANQCADSCDCTGACGGTCSDCDTAGTCCDTPGACLSVFQVSSNIPTDFTISQNYPNPFNPVTSISFDVPKTDEILLAVYDLSGKKIITLASGKFMPGTYLVNWDATNHYGYAVASGMYVYRYISRDKAITRKMLYLK